METALVKFKNRTSQSDARTYMQDWVTNKFCAQAEAIADLQTAQFAINLLYGVNIAVVVPGMVGGDPNLKMNTPLVNVYNAVSYMGTQLVRGVTAIYQSLETLTKSKESVEDENIGIEMTKM